MNNILTKWVKDKREKWFHCNEKNEIDKLLEESFIAQTYALETKKSFISRAISALRIYQKDEELSDKLYIFDYIPRRVPQSTQQENIDVKIKSIIGILYERKKDIIEKRRNIVAWSGIGLSLILGVTGVFLSLGSNTKLNDEQFKDIKQSIEKLKPSDIKIIK